MSDPNYSEYITQKRAREATAVDLDLGTSDEAGWFFRELADGTVEWRPEDQPWAPPGYRWAIDPHDRAATGGPQYTPAGARVVAKLEQINPGPTHPGKRPDEHIDSGFGSLDATRYGS